MTPALTPALAVRYLRELSADVRGGVVLGAAGERLGGDPELAGPAAGAVAAMGASARAEAVLPAGAVLAARDGDLAIVVVCGPHALPALARLDVAQVLADLGAGGDGPGEAAAPAALPPAIAEALISAAPRGPGE